MAEVDALARWSDRQLGEVPPTEFIPVAEVVKIDQSFLGPFADVLATVELVR